MRKPIQTHQLDRTDEEIRAQAVAAKSMIEGASIKSKTSDTDEPVTNEPVVKKNPVLSSLLGGTINKYSRESNEKKNFSLALNFYEKGALYTLAKRDQVKMQSFFLEMGIKTIIKKAEAIGYNAEIAEQLHEAGLIK